MDRYTMVVALSGQICGTVLIISIIAAWVMRRRKPVIAPNEGFARLESRLTEMQQSLDAVAIEVERISEGQRFATKLLAERGSNAAAPNNIRETVSRGPAR
ncbi:MAG: hypothetical protein ACJ796_03570 [Gemmatimonadaceae bacterium]